MGNLHLWKDDDCTLQRRGLHQAGTLCDGEEADQFIQFDADLYMEKHFTDEEIDDLTNGYPVVKELDF